MIPTFLLLTSYYFLAQEVPAPDTARLSAWLIDALVRALDADPDLREVLALLEAELVELAADLPHELLQLLLQRRPPLEMVQHLEKNQQHRRQRRRVDQPRRQMRRIRCRQLLSQDVIGRKKEEGRYHECSRF